MMRQAPKAKTPTSVPQGALPQHTANQLEKKLQTSPRLREQQQLQKMVKQSPRQAGQSKDESGLSAAEKAMLLQNALLAEEEEEKQKKL